MTAQQTKRTEVLAALRPLRADARRLGITFHARIHCLDFLTLGVGVDPELPAAERTGRWTGFAPRIVAALEGAGHTIDRSAWDPAEGRTFAILY